MPNSEQCSRTISIGTQNIIPGIDDDVSDEILSHFSCLLDSDLFLAIDKSDIVLDESGSLNVTIRRMPDDSAKNLHFTYNLHEALDEYDEYGFYCSAALLSEPADDATEGTWVVQFVPYSNESSKKRIRDFWDYDDLGVDEDARVVEAERIEKSRELVSLMSVASEIRAALARSRRSEGGEISTDGLDATLMELSLDDVLALKMDDNYFVPDAGPDVPSREELSRQLTSVNEQIKGLKEDLENLDGATK